jgi:flagellar hook-associated protein FlgK
MYRLAEVRDSISEVSLNEELTEIMKIQYAYEAPSKVISATNHMMQALLDLR